MVKTCSGEGGGGDFRPNTREGSHNNTAPTVNAHSAFGGVGDVKQIHVMMREPKENTHELVESRRTAQAAYGADTQESATVIGSSRSACPTPPFVWE